MIEELCMIQTVREVERVERLVRNIVVTSLITMDTIAINTSTRRSIANTAKTVITIMMRVVKNCVNVYVRVLLGHNCLCLTCSLPQACCEMLLTLKA